MGEEVVEPDLQSLGAGGGPERAAVGVFEDSGPAERGLQRGCGVAVGAGRVISTWSAGGLGGGGWPASSATKTRFMPIR